MKAISILNDPLEYLGVTEVELHNAYVDANFIAWSNTDWTSGTLDKHVVVSMQM